RMAASRRPVWKWKPWSGSVATCAYSVRMASRSSATSSPSIARLTLGTIVLSPSFMKRPLIRAADGIFYCSLEYSSIAGETMPGHRDFKDALYGQFARIGHALASPKRIELLDLLGQGERTVESLADETATAIKNASAHLRVLRQARLVETRR